MKPTNETVTIELEHAPTDKIYSWKFSPHSVPAKAYLDGRIDALQKEHTQLKEEHDLPTNEEGAINFDHVEDEDLILRISEINQNILKYQMDSICCILKPAEQLPPGYDNKRQLLEECITSYEIIPLIMNFFSKHSGNTTVLPADGSPPIRFRKANGETFDPFPEWTKKRKASSSPEKKSSTD